MISQWISQIGFVVRLEMRKTFFSRRGIWVYLLALAPVLIFLGHSLSEISNRNERRALNAAHPVSTEALRASCRKKGMLDLRESGMRALYRGLTTIEEVVRETVLEEGD